MIRSTLSATSISSWATTFTSGLSAVSVLRADSTFFSPMRSVVWMTWRWRFERSTTSKSMIPSVPTPAAARYSDAGAPRPAGADQQHLRLEQLRLAGRAHLGDQQVAAVAGLLLLGQADGLGPLEALALPGLEAALHRSRRRCSPCRPASGRRTGSGCRRRSTARRARHGPGRRPRCPARCSSSRRGWRRARGPGPTRTPRGRRSAPRRRAGAARPSRRARSRGSRRGRSGEARHRSWASVEGAPGVRRAAVVDGAMDDG